MLFARSATVGGQQFPVHWGGDCESTYQSMAESLRGGLSLGLAGFGFWSHDIGGFEGTPSAALFKRWTAFGLLSSHSRLHGSESLPGAVGLRRRGGRRHSGVRRAEEPADAVPVGLRGRGAPVRHPDDASDAAGVPRGPDVRPARPPVHARAGPARRAGLRRRRATSSSTCPRGRWVGLLDGQVVEGPGWVRQRHGVALPAAPRASGIGARPGQPDGPARLRRRRRSHLRGLRPRRRLVVDHPPLRRPGARTVVTQGLSRGHTAGRRRS